MDVVEIECPTCKGKGKIYNSKTQTREICIECDGKGKVIIFSI